MAQSSSARRGIVFLKLAVTVLLCYLILRSVDLAKFAETIRGLDPIYLLVPCLLYPVGLAISAIKLKWLLAGYQLDIPIGAAFEVNWIAGFFNNFLPSSVGGDVYRVIYLNRSYPDKPAQVVSAILIDRGLGLLALLVITGLSCSFFLDDLVPAKWLRVVLYSVIALTAVAGFCVLFVPHKLRIANETRSAIVNRIINGINILIGYPDKRALGRALGISFLFWILVVLSHYFLFLAFNSRIDPLLVLFVVPVLNLAGMIPVSINAIGVTEGVGIVLLGHFGFEPELVLSIFLTGRILLILCSVTGGVPFLLRGGVI